MIVNMPDGKKVTFPDDVERSKVREFINKKYPDAFKSLNIDISKLSGTDVMNSDGLNSSPMQKLDTMLTFAGMLAKGNKKLEPVNTAITAARAVTNTDYSKLGSEALKSLGRQITELTAGSTGFYVKNAGRLLHDDYLSEEDFNKEQPFNTPYAMWKANQTVSDILTNFGKSIEDLSDKVQNSDILKGDEQLFEGSFEENPNLHKVIDLSMSGASSLVGAYAVSKVANPTVAMYFMSGADAKDVLEESLEAGKSKAESFGLWTAATIGTAKLEKLGFEKVFGVKITKNGMQAIVDSSKKTSEKILEGMLSEGAEEGLQTIWQNTVAKIGYDESRDIFQNALESAIGGALGGGLVSSFNYGIQSFKKKSTDAGLSEQEQDNIVNAIGQAVADNPSLVDAPFQENMKKTYESFSKMIEEMGDTPERQRLIATKNALDTGYNKYYEEFKNYMPEEQAKANASLLRSSALFFSDLDGITVDEWFKTKAPQIKRFDDITKQAKEFADNVTPTKLKRLKKKRETKTPSMLQFIRLNGGIRDDGGELKNMDAGKQFIGLVNKNGVDVDEMGEKLWESGYFMQRPTPAEVLDFIDDELKGIKHYPLGYVKQEGITQDENEARLDDAISEYADIMGYDLSKMSYDEKTEIYAQMQKNLFADETQEVEPEETENFAFADNEFFQVADENARLDDIYPEYKGETININGQEKTVYNSNGDRIAKSKEALENFYKWFGDSKVVDEQGRPLVVYHGTLDLFDAFDKERIGDRWSADERGFFFIDRENLAKRYATSDFDESRKGYIMPVYISAKKPLIIDRKYALKNGLGSKVFDREDSISFWDNYQNFVLEEVDKNKNDAVIVNDDYSRMVVAFEPNQIKSTSNRGTYSESENIYYQFAGEKAKTAALDELDRAKQLEDDGVDNEEIRQQTGWFKGVDGKWRFEISDKDAKINAGFVTEGRTRLGNVLAHKKLYQAYPQLNHLLIRFINDKDVDFSGKHTPETNFEEESIIINLAKTDKDKIKSVLLHEIQHSIQGIEKFASGGSPSSVVQEIRDIAERLHYKKLGEFEELSDKANRLADVLEVYRFSEKPDQILNSHVLYEHGSPFSMPSKRDKKARKEYRDFLYDIWWQEMQQKYEDRNDWEFFDLVRDGNKKEVQKEYYSLRAKAKRLLDKTDTKALRAYEKLVSDIDNFNISASDAYYRLYGEVEARNTESRMDLTEEERRAKTPESTQDVKNADAIIVFDDGTAMAYEPETYYQSAFAGSRVDYDRPSLEAIGSGEGNQAHGWGLYYALNRNVAEDYRKRFVGIENRGKAKIINKKTNEEITSENNFDIHYALTRIANFNRDLNKGKKEYIKFLEDELENNKDDSFVQEETSKILETVKKLSVDDYKVEGLNYGQVHEVDIPENPYLMDEQKTLTEQSETVKKAISELLNIDELPQNPYDYITDITKGLQKSVVQNEVLRQLLNGKIKNAVDELLYSDELTTKQQKTLETMNMTGRELYENLSEKLGSNKAASQHLEKLGVKGITYDGRQDGRCFVIFNPDDVKVIQKFYQNEQAPLGAYVNRVIYLNETANASTLPHELAHFWSDELKRSKSLRAKEILKQADVWENREFERKYKIVKQENGFAVTDKDGKTVYDKMGDGFATEEQAKAYAKEELFARGFEKYIKEGKAPNKTLKQAFRNFYNWLKKIYVDMLSLDIKLSPNMRNLYADILGGTSIDTFLDSEIDDFIDKRTQAEEDKSKQVQGIIEQAQANDVSTMPDKIRKAWRESDWGDIWKKIAIPLSTRAKRISPKLRTKIRQFEFDVMDTKQNYYRQAESMLKKWDNFSKEDKIAFDLALKNSTTDIRDEILKKYNATEDFAKVQKVLEDIYEQALNAGLEVGYLEDYFPRKIIDKDGLMTYLHNTEEWSGFQQALQREDPRGEFSAEEQAEFIDKYLRGIVRADLASYKYSSEKQRKLDIIDNNINQYYADSMQALLSYIDGMNARIQTSNFFGRNRQNIDESIGEFIAYMLNNGEIKPSQIDEVKNILTAVFKRRGVSSKGVKFARDISYIYTMGGINTAITQLDDWFVAAYKGGAINTFKAVFSKDVVTKKDLGLESIAAEFMEGTGTAKAVNWVFKHNGIELIDGFGKNALLNGTLRRLQSMSDAELREYVEPIMEERTDSTIADIRNRNLSKDVRFFLFNELSDMQPVSLSELPELYNVGGNARIFYMLKSFMLKRIDTIRNECYDKIRSNDKAERLKGWQNLYKLAFLMMLGGATKDLIIDLMYRRVVDISDMMVNNLLGMVGISKYNIYQVREEGLGHTLAIFATPPLFQVFEDLSGDVSKYIDGKRELKDFEVFKGLPMIGRFYYWWIGGGHTKTEKKKKKGS